MENRYLRSCWVCTLPHRHIFRLLLGVLVFTVALLIVVDIMLLNLLFLVGIHTQKVQIHLVHIKFSEWLGPDGAELSCKP